MLPVSVAQLDAPLLYKRHVPAGLYWVYSQIFRQLQFVLKISVILNVPVHVLLFLKCCRYQWLSWMLGGRGFNPRRGRQHSFVEIDHEIFSTVILSLPLIQELSVSGERMCTILVNPLED